MSTIDSGDRLYRLLPALYRQRDAARGEPLRALLGAMEAELRVLEDDIDRLYDNWFIETCEEWVVPYLGDLVGVRGLTDEKHSAFSQRARVASALSFRRRKGTIGALQDTARDTAGWPTRAVEFFRLLCAAQHVRHPRAGKGGTVDLRARADLEHMQGPFDTVPRSVDVRRISSGRGWHNLPSVGIFVCRLQSYPLTHRAHAVADPPDGRYSFDALGRDLQLFNRAQTPDAIGGSAAEAHLPLPLGRRSLGADLAAYRIGQADTPPTQRPDDSTFYGPGRALAIVKDGQLASPFELASADLSDWRRPQTGVAVDVQLGRIAFAAGQEPASGVIVSYNYGFGADLGGGPYDRRASVQVAGSNTWQGCVLSTGAEAASASGRPRFANLTEALRAWADSGQPGLIEILDSESYQLPVIDLPPRGALAIQAADGVRPSIRTASVTVGMSSAATAEASSGAALSINGLVFAGGVQIVGDLRLALLHCSVPGGLAGAGHHHDLRIGVASCILGALQFPSEGVAIDIQDSIIEGEVTAASLDAHRATLFGPVSVKEVGLASESIFAAPLVVARQQSGAMRFSYVADGSKTPPRFRCQPDLALSGALIDEQVRTRRRVAPSFTSRRYGDPGYAQLSERCAAEISTGAADGSEMGAFHDLFQAQRSANLRANLAEYVPLGLETGIIFVT